MYKKSECIYDASDTAASQYKGGSIDTNIYI